MRSTTRMVLAANNVGDGTDSILIHHGTFTECVLELSKWLAPRSMTGRFDVVFARSEEEARRGIRIRAQSKDSVAPSDLESMLTGLMNQEGNDDEIAA